MFCDFGYMVKTWAGCKMYIVVLIGIEFGTPPKFKDRLTNY